MTQLIGATFTAIGIGCVWFVTLVGGWADVASFIGEEVSTLSQSSGSDTDSRTQLQGAVLASGDQFGLPSRISVVNDRLLVLDQFGESAITELDRHSGATVRTFGRTGEGPGEFKVPVSLLAEDDSLAVLDAGNNRVTWLRRAGASFAIVRIVPLTLESVATDIAATSDNTLLVIGLNSAGRLAILDARGKLLSYRGGLPQLEHLPPARQVEALQGALRADPSRKRHTLTSRFASRIEVFDQAGSESITLWGPERFGPKSGRYVTRFGYLDSAPVERGIIALYSGRTRDDFPGSANYGSTLHRFDGDGQLAEIHHLDSDLISIASSEDGRRVYGIRHDPIPAIVVYDLH